MIPEFRWEAAMDYLDRLFLAHPRTVGESYLEHSAFALHFASRLLLAGMAALVHAAVPCLCETTASRIILGMHAEIVARRAAANRPQPAPFFGFAEYI